MSVTAAFAGTVTFIAEAPVPTRTVAGAAPVLCATSASRPSRFANATWRTDPLDDVEPIRTAPGRTNFAKCPSA